MTSRHILATGLSRLWAGVLTPAKGLLAADVKITLLYREQVKMFTRQEEGITTIRVRSNLILQTIAFLRCVLTQRPDHVEFYFHSGCWLAIRLQARLCSLLGIPLVCVCTGSELLDFDTHTAGKEKCIRRVFARTTAVILKELYMRDVIRRHGLIDESKTFLISNRVHVRENAAAVNREPVVLFLNLYKRWRHLGLILDAIPAVVREVPTAKFRLVGAGRYLQYETELQEQATRLGILEHVEFLPFTQEPLPYFEEAAVFLLPADVVFCNNALLEAMERSVPAIVADVDGAERIVEHGVDGLVVPREADAIAAAILALLKDETMRVKMGAAARQKILDNFDERQRTSELMSLYQTRVWQSE